MSALGDCLPYLYDLPESSLTFVSKLHQLVVLGKLMKDAIILGIDTETRPNFQHYGSNKRHNTSLLQIAVRCSNGHEFVVIFDLLSLTSSYFQQLSDILIDVFQSNDVIKVGQNLDGDFQELSRSYPNMPCFQRVHGIVEINAMYRVLNPNETEVRSLKHFVKVYLHSDLVKSQQKSNWAARPLSKKQIQYAACDALVLIRLYDTLTCDIVDKFEKYDLTSLHLSYPDCMATHYHGIRKKPKDRNSLSVPVSPQVEHAIAITSRQQVVVDTNNIVETKQNFHTEVNAGVKRVVVIEQTTRKRTRSDESNAQTSQINAQKNSSHTVEFKNSKLKSDTLLPSQRSTNTNSHRNSSKRRCSINASDKIWQPLHLSRRSSMPIGEVAQRFVKAKTG